jgi:dihydroorotate dehydrogenase (fumarate)
MDLSTNYMGLTLRNPLVASGSPLTGQLANLRALEDAGAAAIVLPSMFAEQIEAEDQRHEHLTRVGALSSPEASSYFPAPHLNSRAADRTLALIESARAAVHIPVIASLNAASVEGWTDFATQMQHAGASAIELNIYFVPTDLQCTGAEVERRYLHTVRAVKHTVQIPVAVKTSPYFSSPGHMALQLAEAGADALVLYNRFYQPDIDTVRLQLLSDLALSRSADMRLPLLWLAVLHGRIGASLAASTGVQTSDDVVKYLLAGADVVMSTSALLTQGIGHLRTLLDGLSDWLEQRDMDTLHPMRGLLAQRNARRPEDYERANYIQILQGYSGIGATTSGP